MNNLVPCRAVNCVRMAVPGHELCVRHQAQARVEAVSTISSNKTNKVVDISTRRK